MVAYPRPGSPDGFQVPAISRYRRGDRRMRVPRSGCCARSSPSPPPSLPHLLSVFFPASSASMYLECPFSPQSSGLSEPLQIRVAPRSFRAGIPPTADRDSVEIKHDLSVAIKASHVEMRPEKSASPARTDFLIGCRNRVTIDSSVRKSVRDRDREVGKDLE